MTKKPKPLFKPGQFVRTTKWQPTTFKIRYRRWAYKSYWYSPGPRWYPSYQEAILERVPQPPEPRAEQEKK